MALFFCENKIVALNRLGLYYIYLYFWQIVITCIIVNFIAIPQKVVLKVKYLSGFIGCLSNWGPVIRVCGCWWRIIRVLYTIFLNKENFDCFGVGKCSLVPQFLLLVSFEESSRWLYFVIECWIFCSIVFVLWGNKECF